MKSFVYILKSQKDNKHYIGMSRNVNVRLNQHNTGKVRSTKFRIPLIFIYKEEYNSRIEARNREKYLKSYKGAKEKLKIIESLQSL